MVNGRVITPDMVSSCSEIKIHIPGLVFMRSIVEEALTKVRDEKRQFRRITKTLTRFLRAQDSGANPRGAKPRGNGREAHGHDAATAVPVGHSDVAAVRPGDLLGDAEPQPGAGQRGMLSTAAIEAIEGARQSSGAMPGPSSATATSMAPALRRAERQDARRARCHCPLAP